MFFRHLCVKFYFLLFQQFRANSTIWYLFYFIFHRIIRDYLFLYTFKSRLYFRSHGLDALARLNLFIYLFVSCRQFPTEIGG